MDEQYIIERAQERLSPNAFTLWRYFYDYYKRGSKSEFSLYTISDATGIDPYQPMLDALLELSQAGYFKTKAGSIDDMYDFYPEGA